jgi:hypothetical protein
MRSLLAYLLAVSAFLGTTYVGLEWLSEPARPIIRHAPDKATAETTVASERRRDENTAGSGGHGEASQTVPKPPPNQPAPAPPPGPGQFTGDSQPPVASNTEESHSGGCAPLGLTAQGKLVFPLECNELLTRNREARESETSTSNSSDPAPAESQDLGSSGPPAKSAGDQTADQKPADTKTKGKLTNENTRPVRHPKPAKEIAEEVPKTGKPEGRPAHNTPPSGMTMIMRTIFPRW